MQSVALMAGYIAGTNKESMDCKLFDRDKAKTKAQKQQKEPAAEEKKKNKMMGKSKKFNIDRYFAIIDFILSMTADET